MLRRLAAAGIVALLATPSAARAQSWVLCTPGAFKSCHSVAVSTTPQMSGSVRIGTFVTFTVSNLQGTHPLDNVAWSGLNELSFHGGASTPLGTTGAFATFALNGGATGSGVFQYFSGTGATTDATMFNTTGTGVIRGCAAVPTVPFPSVLNNGASFSTCGSSASVSFTALTQGIFDASVFTYAIIDVETPQGHTRCVSDPNFTASRPLTVACEDHTNDVIATPEPISIALMGTGLAGIGAMRRRRKKPTA